MNDEKPLEPADTVIGHIVRDAMWGAQMDVTDRARLNARLAIRVAKAIQAQRDQATPPAAPETPPADERPHSRPCSTHLHAHGDDCNDACPTCYPRTVGAPKLTSTTVTLPCPDCGEDITDTASLGTEDEGGYFLDFANSETHTCLPAQPDEPTEFGAKATVAQADGHIERWLNMHAPPQGRRGWLTWDARDTAGSTPGQSKWADWSEITQRGTVALGWDE